MATLIFSAIGTAVGGPLGGAIGALAGRAADGAILAPPGVEGPRLQELAVSTSSYGNPIARHFGRMRVPGTIIWATDLAEHRSTQGGGKGKPSVTTYSYSVSFAVALSSRPLAGLGRIWADGSLLRGAGGDLKSGGQLRFYGGYGDQPIDPLLAAAEAIGACPAYRGVAYVVFQDLPLSDYGNRIPMLSFEVMSGDDPITASELIGESIPNMDARLTLNGISGVSVEADVAGTLAQIGAVVPFSCDVAGDRLTIAGDSTLATTSLSPPAVAVADEGFGGKAGYRRKRSPGAQSIPGVIRYFDPDRDYQAGTQRASGRTADGIAHSIELPATLSAGAARALVDSAARRARWGRQTLSWRTAALDPAVLPGVLVSVPGEPGLWRVTEWDWRASGVELQLERAPGAASSSAATPTVDPGRAATAADVQNGPSVLFALELPWDGSGQGDAQTVYVAASSPSPGWSGAALFSADGSGGLQPLGSTGRARCVIGTTESALPDASSLVPDWSSVVTVTLIGADMELADATGRAVSGGANRALIGSEIVQFARAVPLGGARWRLSGLLRGRGGTEAMTGSHVSGEPFVLIDDRLTPLERARIGPPPAAITAIGQTDTAPVTTSIRLPDIGRRPLFPVHPTARTASDGSLSLSWTRRARGAWAWPDQVDTPLHEEVEAYEVVCGDELSPFEIFPCAEPRMTIPPERLSALRAAHPGAPISVRQRGSYALSACTLLTHLT